jgi:uncharacterized ubiquitin-like protein YukD
MEMKVFVLIAASLFFVRPAFSTEICTPLLKTTKYKVEKGDHIALVLRKFGLDPVFTKSGSLSKLLKMNQIENQDLIEPASELVMPFACEEQIVNYVTVDKGEYRLVTLDQKIQTQIAMPQATASQKVDTVLPTPEFVALENKAKIVSEEQKLTDILKPDGTAVVNEPKDIELENKTADEISEALRYRMICEGEWTGTQCVTRYSVLYVEGSGWYNRYDGTDPVAPDGTNNKGLLLSKLNPQIKGGWHNYWTENFKTDFSVSVQNSAILPEAREIPIEQDKKILSTIHAEARYEFGALGVGIGLQNYDKLFYRFRFSGLSQPCLSNTSSFAGCGVFVHSANIMGYFANVNWLFHQAGKFTYDAKLNMMLLGRGATGGFEVYNGLATDLSFTVRHDRIREYIYATVQYGVSSQDTSIEKQTAQELGFIFGYAWKLKDW